MSRLSNAIGDLRRNVRDSAAAARAPSYRSWNNFSPDERRQLEQQAAREEQARQWDIRQAKRAIAEEIDKLENTFRSEERHVNSTVKPNVERAKSAFTQADKAWARAKEEHKAAERKFKEVERTYNRDKGSYLEPTLRRTMDTLRKLRDAAKTKMDQAKGPRDRAEQNKKNAEKLLRESEKKASKAKGEWRSAQKYK